MPTATTPAPDKSGAITQVSRAVGKFRWAFMPLGLAALLAVGIHAAADTVCEHLLWLTDRFSEAWDHFWANFDLTSSFVGAISFAARTRVARGAALAWELSADLVIALPALGYHEKPPTPLARAADDWRKQLRRVFKKPTTLRLMRPWQTGAFALAGACAVAKMVQSTLYFQLHQVIASGHATYLAQFVALLVLGAVAVSFGARAMARSLEHVDERSEEDARAGAKRWTVGLIGSALALPLALAAFIDASPVLSFFR